MSKLLPGTGGAVRRSNDLERMWQAMLLTGWQCLVVIPADAVAASQLVLDALQVVLSAKIEDAPEIVDGRGATIKEGESLARKASESGGRGRRVIAFVDPITQSLAGVPVIRSADSALLIIQVDFPDVDSLASTLSIVGPDRVVGSVTVPAST